MQFICVLLFFQLDQNFFQRPFQNIFDFAKRPFSSTIDINKMDSYDCGKQFQVFCTIPVVSMKFGGAVVHVRCTA